MTTAEKVAREDVSKWTDAQLVAVKNLADFEARGIVVGDRVFAMLKPKVEAELARRRAENGGR